MQGLNPAAGNSLEGRGREIVERLGGAWQRGSGMCRCPAHEDRHPSLSVRVGERRLLFHCFAGCRTPEVMRALRELHLRLSAEDRRSREPVPAPADADARHRGAAERLWAAARALPGSPAQAYLRGRGLAPATSELRYHPRTPYGRGAQAIFLPALLAAVRDGSGLVGVHRTFLDSGTPGLADLAQPRRALGRLGRGAARLHQPLDGMLGLAEGIESALAATELTGIPCWATLGAERFGRIARPASVTRLILFLDNDAGGRRAETLARGAHGAAVAIEARYPRAAGEDWNDLLLARRPQG